MAGETGISGFHPGVDHGISQVDLSGEFERQFFGDVMLFRVIDLVDQGYPRTLPERTDLHAQVVITENRMREHYVKIQQNVSGLLGELETFLSGSDSWWNDGQHEYSCSLFRQFTKSLHANYGRDARAWQLIDDETDREARRAAIVDALLSYPRGCGSWVRALEDTTSSRHSLSLRGT